MNSIINTVASTLRLIIAAVLIASGIMKGVNLQAVEQTVRDYLILFGFNPPAYVVYIAAFASCTLEIWLGMIAMNKRFYIHAYQLYIIVLTGFTFLTYVNLISPLGNHNSCGCFGEIIPLNTMDAFIKNVILSAISVVLAIISITKGLYFRDGQTTPPLSLKRYALICGGASLLPVTVSAVFMDRLAAFAYIVLYIITSFLSILIAVRKSGHRHIKLRDNNNHLYKFKTNS